MEADAKTPYIPKFSIKSALLILLASLLGGIVIPYLFHLLGLNVKLSVMLFLPVLIGLAVTYGQFFIETKRGLTRSFWYTLTILTIILELASYFWLFKGIIF